MYCSEFCKLIKKLGFMNVCIVTFVTKKVFYNVLVCFKFIIVSYVVTGPVLIMFELTTLRVFHNTMGR